jgi:hypothetical protein
MPVVLDDVRVLRQLARGEAVLARGIDGLLGGDGGAL